MLTHHIIGLEIGGIGISLNIENLKIKNRLRIFYKNFISRRKPDIWIDAVGQNFLKPSLKSLILETPTWKLGKEHNSLFIYFPSSNPSLASFNHTLNKIKFYTHDSSGQLLLYLFPEILFSLILPKNKGLLLHACGILNKKKGYLFVAKAGGGKSTLAKLALKNGFIILNDDRIILRKDKDLFRIYGSPWHGEVKSTENKSLPIKEIFFLRKAKSCYLKPINKLEALEELLKNSFFLPINNDIIKKRFNLCVALVENLRCFKLYFRPEKSIWSLLNGDFKSYPQEK